MSPSQLPEGEAPPVSGDLPVQVLDEATSRSLSAYVHIPFCASRCGYCDFNTYVATELDAHSQSQYAAHVVMEIRQSQRLMQEAGLPSQELNTVFFGGGTPTLLPTDQLHRVLEELQSTFGLQQQAEVTIEANPDSVDAAKLLHIKKAGFTRVSFGMQSAVPTVLATLERTHDPQRVPKVVKIAQDVGLDVSVDVIYGTPGETLDDWRQTLDAVIALELDHVSAYALIVEQGTAMSRKIAAGKLEPVDDDLQADMYELANARFEQAGLSWYEVSNWAQTSRHQSRHNLNYWLGQNWWGYGPGAHSHLGSMRQWNVKHPREYAGRLIREETPVAAREILSSQAMELEETLLRSRLATGFDVSRASGEVVEDLVHRGLITVDNLAVLTLQGRLRADEVVRLLTE